MTREELEHAIRAACDLTRDDEIYVFGSQAILGQVPDAPASLRQSMEVDVSPVNHPDRIEAINGVLGEDSQFKATYGFYVHGVPIDEAAKLPSGWKGRVIVVRVPVATGTGEVTGLCLEGHDLAASKLAAFRDKDRDFVRELLVHELVQSRKLIARIRTLPLGEDERERRVKWVDLTCRELPG